MNDPDAMRCRLDGQGDSAATYIDESHISCPLAAANKETRFFQLRVSNDRGTRWAAGVTINNQVLWYNGSTDVARPFSIDFPETLVVGVMVPSIEPEYTLAVNAALAAVNEGGILPFSRLTSEFIVSNNGDAASAVKAASAFAVKEGVIGIAGGFYSSASIPVALEVSNKYKLPMVSWGAGSTVLGNKTTFPFFVRTNPSSSNLAVAMSVFFKSMSWKRVAIITSDETFAQNMGKIVEKALVEPLYRGVVPMIEANANGPQIELALVSTIRRHVLNIAKTKARIIFVYAVLATTMEGILLSLHREGLIGTGFGIVTIQIGTGIQTLLARRDTAVLLNGLIGLAITPATACVAQWCPPTGPPLYLTEETRSTIGWLYDSIYTVASGVAPIFRENGGRDFLAGPGDAQKGSRKKAMDNLRSLEFGTAMMASGSVSFEKDANVSSAATLLICWTQYFICLCSSILVCGWSSFHHFHQCCNSYPSVHLIPRTTLLAATGS